MQAGDWNNLVNNFQPGDAERWIATYAKVSRHAFALRIIGDSMTNPSGVPSFPEGTIIIVGPERAAQPPPDALTAVYRSVNRALTGSDILPK